MHGVGPAQRLFANGLARPLQRRIGQKTDTAEPIPLGRAESPKGGPSSMNSSKPCRRRSLRGPGRLSPRPDGADEDLVWAGSVGLGNVDALKTVDRVAKSCELNRARTRHEVVRVDGGILDDLANNLADGNDTTEAIVYRTASGTSRRALVILRHGKDQGSDHSPHLRSLFISLSRPRG
jgi:hypothetical protein